jgi:hypothetical protein
MGLKTGKNTLICGNWFSALAVGKMRSKEIASKDQSLF